MIYNPACYLAKHGYVERDEPMPPCAGRLIRAHLLPKQLLKREVPAGAEMGGVIVTLAELIESPSSWVWACGGLGGYGSSGHHGMFDTARRLRLPYEALPVATIKLAETLGLDWWLEREYGRRGPSRAA